MNVQLTDTVNLYRSKLSLEPCRDYRRATHRGAILHALLFRFLAALFAALAQALDAECGLLIVCRAGAAIITVPIAEDLAYLEAI